MEALGKLAPRGTSKGTWASARVRLARTMRWATVGSVMRKARAISSVVRPPSSRSVSATRASVEQNGMTGDEHEAEEIVADIVVNRGVEIGDGGLLPGLHFVAELLLLPVVQAPSAEQVDGAVLGRGHEPGARIVRDPARGPTFQGRDEGVLGQVLGQADVAHYPGETGDEPGRLDPPYRVDRAVGIGSRHGHQSA